MKCLLTLHAFMWRRDETLKKFFDFLGFVLRGYGVGGLVREADGKPIIYTFNLGF